MRDLEPKYPDTYVYLAALEGRSRHRARAQGALELGLAFGARLDDLPKVPGLPRAPAAGPPKR